MKFSHIPRVYLTMACNYKCSYCTNYRPGYQKLSGSQWIELLNKIPGDTVIFTGGEPTLHPDFAQIVNGVEKEEVRVYTNMSWDESLLDQIQRPIRVYGSYHPGQKMDTQAVIKRTLRLLTLGHDLISIHINRGSGETQGYVEEFKRFDIELVVEDNFFEQDFWLNRESMGTVICNYERLYLAPDGTRYSCVHKLEAKDPTGIVPLGEMPVISRCHVHGQCSICDLRVHEITPYYGMPFAIQMPNFRIGI